MRGERRSLVIGEVNFLPSWYSAVIRRRRRFRVQLAALALLVVTLLAVNLRLAHGNDEITARAAATQEELRRRHDPRSDLATIRERTERLKRSLVDLRGLEPAIGYGDIAGLVIRSMPESIAVRSMNLSSGPDRRMSARENRPGLPASGPSRGRGTSPDARTAVDIEIEGIAPSDREVGRLVEAMTALSIFEDVKIRNWRQGVYEGLVVHEFSLHATVPIGRIDVLSIDDEVSDAQH